MDQYLSNKTKKLVALMEVNQYQFMLAIPSIETEA